MPDNLRHAQYDAFSVQIDDPQRLHPPASTSGNIRDAIDLAQLARDTSSSDEVLKVQITPGAKITLESPITLNTARLDLDGNHAQIITGNIAAGVKPITLNYTFQDYNDWRRYAFTPALRNLRLIGPGVNLSADYVGAANCTTAIYTTGVLGNPNRAIRPKLYNCFISGYDIAYEMGDVSFLGSLDNCILDKCGIAVVQRSATDSGEMVMLNDVVIQRTYLAFYLKDGSSEIVWNKGSVDYGTQICVIDTGNSWGALTLRDVHWEPRGKFDGSDVIGYPVTGSGIDPRALIPGRDAVYDIAGNGSRVIVSAGLLDLNTNNLNPALVLPWADIKCLAKTRDKNSAIIVRDASPQTLANVNQLFHWGLGQVDFNVSRLMFPSENTLPARKSNNPLHNALKHGHFPAANIEDLWTIRRDTSEITNRWTGANGSIARDNAIHQDFVIDPALTLSATTVGTRTVTSTVDAFSADMVGRLFIVGAGTATVVSVDTLQQMTVNVTVDFASTAIAAGTAITKTTGSLKITKVGAAGTNFEVACLIDVPPGKIATVHGYVRVPSVGGVTGTPSISMRWVKRGLPRVTALSGAGAANYLQTIPVEAYPDLAGADWDIGSGREANVIRQVDVNTAVTNSWQPFILTVPSSEIVGYGSMQCPEWSGCLELAFSMNGAGAGFMSTTNITVSLW